MTIDLGVLSNEVYCPKKVKKKIIILIIFLWRGLLTTGCHQRKMLLTTGCQQQKALLTTSYIFFQ